MKIERLGALTGFRAKEPEVRALATAAQRETDNIYANLSRLGIEVDSEGNGLALSGGVLSLGLASESEAGAMSSEDYVLLHSLNDALIQAGNVTSVERANWNTAYSHSQVLGGNPHNTVLDDLGDVTISAPSANQVLQYDGSAWVNSDLLLSEVGNPSASKTFTMANKAIKFTFTAPIAGGSYDGAFEIEATGAFTGDVFHVHQHTGNPGAGSHLVHLEATDADVVALGLGHLNASGVLINYTPDGAAFTNILYRNAGAVWLANVSLTSIGSISSGPLTVTTTVPNTGLTVVTAGTTKQRVGHVAVNDYNATTSNLYYSAGAWYLDDVAKPGWGLQMRSDGTDNFTIFRASAGANPRSATTLITVSNSGGLTVASSLGASAVYPTAAGGGYTYHRRSVVPNNQTIGVVSVGAYDFGTTTYVYDNAQIVFTGGVWAAGSRPVQVAINTTPSGSTTALTRFIVGADGVVTIGSANANGSGNLYIGQLYVGTTQIIDSSRNLLNIGTIGSGAITSTGVLTVTTTTTPQGYFKYDSDRYLAIGHGLIQGNALTAQNNYLTIEMVGGATYGSGYAGGILLRANAVDSAFVTTTGAFLMRTGGGVAGAAGSVRDISWYSGGFTAPSLRWIARMDSVAESGGNAGSDWQLYARDDAGAALGTVLTFTRATGATVIGAFGAGTISFKIANTVRWFIDGNGHLAPNADNTYDIGSVTYSVRSLYVQTSILPLNDATLLGTTGTGFKRLVIEHATNQADGIILRQTAATTVSPRLFFDNPTSWSGSGIALWQSGANTFVIASGATPLSGSGTSMLSITPTTVTAVGGHRAGVDGAGFTFFGSGAYAGALGLKVANTTTAQSAILALGEDTGSLTPFYIQRYGSTHPTLPGQVLIRNAGDTRMVIQTGNGDMTFASGGADRLKLEYTSGAAILWNPNALGGTLGNVQLLLEVGGEANTSNVYLRTWLYRDATNTNWQYSRIHEGVSVDGSFGVPRTDTRVWWERDPNDQLFAWGSGATEYLQLTASSLLMSGSTNVSFRVNGAGYMEIGNTTATVRFSNDGAVSTIQGVANSINLGTVRTDTAFEYIRFASVRSDGTTTFATFQDAATPTFGVNVNTVYTDAKTLYNTSFTSGWTGSGWKLSVNASSEYELELDTLWVRGTLHVYELLIQQIRATNGSIYVTAAQKVDAIVTPTAGAEVVDMEDPAGHNVSYFLPGDIVIAQRVKVNDPSTLVKRIVRKVSSVTGRRVTFTTATGGPVDTATVEAGDDYVRIGSETDTARQGSVYMTSDDSNSPYIEVIDGVASWADWKSASKLKVRLGKLTGIGSLAGYGAYIQNSGGSQGVVIQADATLAKIALGATPGSITVAGTEVGFIVDGNGSMKVYGSAGNFIRMNGGALEVQAGVFTLVGGTTLYINSTTPIIALGPSASSITVANTNTGVAMDGSGGFKAYFNTTNYIRVAGSVDIKASVFTLQAGPDTIFVSSTGPLIALGATASGSTVANTSVGVAMDGAGGFKAYGDASNYIRKTGTSIDIKAGTFSLTTTNMTISSGSLSPASGKLYISGADLTVLAGSAVKISGATTGSIALGSATAILTGNGVWLDGGGNARVGTITTGALYAGFSWDGTIFLVRGNNTTIIDARAGSVTIAGWTATASTLSNGTDIVLDATNKRISILAGAMLIGYNVNSTNSGIYINATNYWYSSGNFMMGAANDYIQNAAGVVTIKGTSASSSLAFGATSQTVGNGVWINGSGSNFRVGNASASRMQWDGTNLEIYSSGNAKIVSLGATNTIYGFTVTPDTLYAVNTTTYGGGAGIFMYRNHDGFNNPQFRVTIDDNGDVNYMVQIGFVHDFVNDTTPYFGIDLGMIDFAGPTYLRLFSVMWDEATLGLYAEIAGWRFDYNYLWKLASGTPGSSPVGGVVIDSTNKAIIAYGGTSSKYVKMFYTSGTDWGVLGTDNGGNTVFQLGYANVIAGWTFTNTQFSATNILLVSGAANTARLEVGTGSNIGGVNSANASGDIVFWAGSTHANRATAAFNVTAGGVLTAVGATLKTASSGARIEWTASGMTFYDSGGTNVGALAVPTYVGGGFTFKLGNAYSMKKLATLQTTNNTKTLLSYIQPYSNPFVTGVSYTAIVKVAAIDTTSSPQKTAGYIRAVTFRSSGSADTIIGSVTSIHTVEETASWDCTIELNSSRVAVMVTGETSKTIQWTCEIEFVEVIAP